ncbi:pantoate--beta-alanine ligase [Desulfuribacillus stibiiarsenatis]|uniref:Pantothenate synthetase n=1 Tax=Desulfuribacillus stibiiarsenatis TaxID=1390249 RepID=A0A1E5L408_9FIRM|nr:pantoate--beta-alanine ligase [Desulfuribacillus stibiiarsenatis]
MPILYTIQEVRDIVSKLKCAGKRIGFVPTMGYLHEGHISLVNESIKENDITIVSIFVNPTQFGENEDFSQYPRDLKRDISLLNDSVDYIFSPSVDTMYPGKRFTEVIVNQYSEGLCGKSRPGHFTGVATVVAKLLNIVSPDQAYFGQKDIQQALIIKQMIRDLDFPVKIRICPIIREANGLAMSSRNVYLTDVQRENASVIYRSFKKALIALKQGQTNAKMLVSTIKDMINNVEGAEIDYIEIRNLGTWDIASTIDTQEYVIAVAVKFGKTRLIDNMIIRGDSIV